MTENRNTTLKDSTFTRFSRLVEGYSGIQLPESKRNLVVHRIARRMRELSIHNYEDYYKAVDRDKTGKELTFLIDSISTNVTHFFREPDHFEYLTKRLSRMKFTSPLRVWCAGCSTGEEAYTLAMTCLEAIPQHIKLKVLATDISTKVLESSQKGIYPEAAFSKVPKHLVLKYFQKGTRKAKGFLRAKPDLYEVIQFGRLNLVDQPFALNGNIDFIFCRNVMIYFNQDIRKKIIQEFLRLLKRGGLLFVGHSESLHNLGCNFKMVGPAMLQKVS